jgi:hypothetical protein
MTLRFVWTAATALALTCGLAEAAQTGDRNAALRPWLPRIGQGFEPPNKGQASWSHGYDYFICGTTPVSSPTPYHDFSFAARGCPALASGTAFEYGPAGPTKGHVVYDAAGKLALYQEGCCAERTTVLASGVGAPPIGVRAAALGVARTARGVALGMTQSAVLGVYGRTPPHSVPGTPGVQMLSYTTIHGNPSDAKNACGQYQNFAFKGGRLVYIELLAGC